MKTFILSFLLSFGILVQAKEVALLECIPSEKVIFQCQIKAKLAILCESRGERIAYRYKYGSSKKVELRLPAVAGSSTNYFRLAAHPTPGGSISYIHFSNRGYDYYLLDDSSKIEDESFSPVSKLIVFKGKNIVNSSICENDSSGIDEDAYDRMPREPYSPTLKLLETHNASPR
ncbi:hypothetical protein [Caballeronia sp. KNU42]